MIARAQTILLVLVLLGAGVLLGSFLLEWRGHELATPASAPEFEGLPSSISPESFADRISVEVLNGAGEAGAAALITEALRDAGYDVKTFGNAPSFEYEKTIVIDRSDRSGAARSVADALGVDEVRSEPRPALYLDATIILGLDWKLRLEKLR
ncbi:MAG: LytR C-terminal domain-containing protein [Gemmatimonadetes bacterium]|nr:LytR C-terminal domain-containing protein [Gemmatimonadota bacterium]MCK5483497.1 LytR C-terminal domain-containing protein [Gemmatimonadota bacterium]